jgi:hypothetical protein
MTNRELYLLVTGFDLKHSKIPSLENYLKSLWALASPFSRTEPTIKNLVRWLNLAFTYPTPDFTSIVFSERFDLYQTGFAYWENIIFLQISDLSQMSESGQLKDEMRYFGINSPNGSCWYNFDVMGYLECAVSGMYGGDNEEAIIFQPSSENEPDRSEIFEIDSFSWKDFGKFLYLGQIYE